MNTMNTKLTTLGVLALFAALSMPTNAYHITDEPTAANGSGLEPLEWGARVGVTSVADDPFTNSDTICTLLRTVANTVGTLNPDVGAILNEVLDNLCTDEPGFSNGDSLFGFVLCEQPSSLTAPSQSGAGGLCFMSAGFKNDSTGNCVFDSSNQGNSNGNYDPYQTTGTEACAAAATPQTLIVAQARNWMEINMQLVHPQASSTTNRVEFVGQIGGHDCDTPAERFVYDEQFAYTVDSGHVSGFPVRDPAAGTFGGYYVSSGASTSGLTECAAFPFYYG